MVPRPPLERPLPIRRIFPPGALLRVILPALLLAGLLVWGVGRHTRDLALEDLSQRLTLRSTVRAGILTRILKDLAADTRFLAATPPVPGIARAARQGGMDQREHSSLALWRDRLDTIFKAYASTNPALRAIRYAALTPDGGAGDIVAVIRGEDGRIADNIRLPPLTADVLSAVVANGDAPYLAQPTGADLWADFSLSSALLVRDEAGVPFGVLSIDLDGASLEREMMADLPPDTGVYLLADTGEVLAFRLGAASGLRPPHLPARWQDIAHATDDEAPGAMPSVMMGDQPYFLRDYVIPLGASGTMRLLALGPGALVDQQVATTRLQLLGALVMTGALLGGLALLHRRQTFRAQIERERLGSILESTNDAVVGMTVDGHVTDWNRGAERMFGYRAPDALGRHIGDLILPEGQEDDATMRIRRVANGLSLPAFEAVRRHRDGRLLDVSISLSPVHDGNGRIIGVASTLRDISGPKEVARRLRESEERLRFALEIAHLGQWEWNLGTGEVLHSPLHDRIYGYTVPVADWSYAIFLDHVHPQDRGAIDQALRQAAEGGGQDHSHEFRIRRPDGKERWLVSHWRRLDGPGGARLMGIVTDITHRKDADLRLRALNESLEQQVAERTLQIEAVSTLQRAILKNAGNAIIATDPGGVITVFNPAAEALLGYDAAEMVGQAAIARLHVPEEMATRAAALSRELGVEIPVGFEIFVAKARRGQVDKQEWTYVRRDGRRLPVLLTVTPMRDEAGVLTGFLGVATDLTQQQRDRQRLVRLSDQLMAAVEIAELGIWTLNATDSTVTWNDRMCAIHGLPPFMGAASTRGNDDGEGASTTMDFADWHRYLHPQDAETVLDRLADAVAGRTRFVMIYRVVRADGAVRHLQTAAMLERADDGQPSRLLGVTRDVTEQLDHEESLRAAKQAADAANQAKSVFLANMSHEIRTPMNAVLGMLQLLQHTDLTPRQADYVGKTESAARTLLALLNDILDFSKVEAGKLTLEHQPYTLDTLLREVGVILSANIGDKEVEVLFEVDPTLPSWLMGDSLRVQQVLINLAGNAVKFTQRGEIVVSAGRETGPDGQDRLVVTVRDTGIGIAAEHLPQLFKGFSQGENSTARRFGGSGLGLAISQRLVQLMGGEISVESQEGVGSTFRFFIPLEAVTAPPIPAPQAVADLHGLRVLIADDNETARRVLGGIVRSFGWVVDEVASGAEALGRLTEPLPNAQRYDVVLVDWRMPDLDGWETSLAIRKRFPREHMPLIVMVTAYGREILARRQDELPAVLDGFLVKPITPSMLFDAVADARAARLPPPPPETPSAASPDPASPSSSLPSSPPSSQGVQEPARNRPLSGRHVLVVEDNLTNQQVARELLMSEGAAVDVANGGGEALTLLEKTRPDGTPRYDVVLMDIQMPGMDGYTATREIRSRLRLAALPVIAMTANAMPADRMAALAAGMNDHVAKPFDIRNLVQVILSHVGGTATPETTAPPQAERAVILQDDVLAWEQALARLDGDLPLYHRILRRFIADIDRMIPDQPPPSPDITEEKDARRALHTLKGLAATAGANRLSALAAKAERAPLADWPTLLPEIAAAGRVAAAAIAAHLDGVPPGAPPPAPSPAPAAPPHTPIDPAPLTLAAGLRALSPLLADNNMAALALAQSLAASVPAAWRDDFARLFAAMDDLDFPRAHEICARLEQECVRPQENV